MKILVNASITGCLPRKSESLMTVLLVISDNLKSGVPTPNLKLSKAGIGKKLWKNLSLNKPVKSVAVSIKSNL